MSWNLSPIVLYGTSKNSEVYDFLFKKQHSDKFIEHRINWLSNNNRKMFLVKSAKPLCMLLPLKSTEATEKFSRNSANPEEGCLFNYK